MRTKVFLLISLLILSLFCSTIYSQETAQASAEVTTTTTAEATTTTTAEDTTTTAAEVTTTTTASEATTTTAAEATTETKVNYNITVAETKNFGTVLVNQDNQILYVYSKDEPGVRNCSAECQKTLSLFLVDKKDAIATKDSKLTAEIGYIDAKVGEKEMQQVTYGDWPLYTYRPSNGNAVSLDVSSQGMVVDGGKMFAINKEGRVVTAFGSTVDSLTKLNAVLTLSENSAYGSKYVCDLNGVVLYVFSNDKFMESTCTKDCVVDFKPYKVENGNSLFNDKGSYATNNSGFKVGTGLNSQLTAAIKANDGTGGENSTYYMMTYNGLPLYYYKDETTKETSSAKTQGVMMHNGYWWLIQADGSVNLERNKDASQPKSVQPFTAGSKTAISSSTGLYSAAAILVVLISLIFA